MKALTWLLSALAVMAFIATVVLAYVGALTDDIHAWQTFFVSFFLTIVIGGAAGLTL